MKINVDHYFIYSTDVLALCTQFQRVVFSTIYMWTLENMQSPVSAFVFIAGNIFVQQNSQDPAEEIYHMLAVSWSTLLPQATSRLRQDDSLPVSSDDFLRQGKNNHPFKGRLRAPCTPTTIIWLVSQRSTKYLTAGTADN